MSVSSIQQQHDALRNNWDLLASYFTEVWEVLSKKRETISDANKKTKIRWRQTVVGVVSRFDFSVCYVNYTLISLPKLCQKLLKDDCDHILSLTESSDTQQLFTAVSSMYGRFKRLQMTVAVIMSTIDAQVHENGKRRKIPFQAEEDYRKQLDVEGMRSFDSNTILCSTSKEMMIKTFHDFVYEKIKAKLIDVVIRVVNDGRNGNRINKTDLKHAVSVFNDIGAAMEADVNADGGESRDYYRADFEDFYVEQTTAFYERESQAYLARDASQHYTFLSWCDAKMKFESNLCEDLFPSRKSSHSRVEFALVQGLLTHRVADIVCHPDSGLFALLNDRKMDEAKNMVHMMSKVPARLGVEKMAKEYERYVNHLGREQYIDAHSNLPPETDSKGVRVVIDNVLTVMEFCKTFNTDCANNDERFKVAENNAFRRFLNESLSRQEKKPDGNVAKVTYNSTQIIISYLDQVLRKELKLDTNEDELNCLQKLSVLFSFLKEKDYFQEMHRHRLSKRLLQTTPDQDLEKAFLEKLKRDMGGAYTHKMEGMINDRDSTQNLGKDFKESTLFKDRCEGKIDFDVQVLTVGYWPTYSACQMKPTGSLETVVTAFQTFYRQKHASRKLLWIHQLGGANVRLLFPKGTKEVQMSLYQATILTEIDRDGHKSLVALADVLAMPIQQVKILLAPMYLSKVYPILKQLDTEGNVVAATNPIVNTTTFVINKEFTHKMRRIKLPLPTRSVKEDTPKEEELDSSRNLQIDSCIVRVMKSRRTMHFNELLDAVMTQLQKYFTPQSKSIKRRVEDLISRDFLERSKDDAATFTYLA